MTPRQDVDTLNKKLERDHIIFEQHKLLQKALSALAMGHQALVNKDEEVIKLALKLQRGVHMKILKFMNEVKIHKSIQTFTQNE